MNEKSVGEDCIQEKKFPKTLLERKWGVGVQEGGGTWNISKKEKREEGKMKRE